MYISSHPEVNKKKTASGHSDIQREKISRSCYFTEPLFFVLASREIHLITFRYMCNIPKCKVRKILICTEANVVHGDLSISCCLTQKKKLQDTETSVFQTYINEDWFQNSPVPRS